MTPLDLRALEVKNNRLELEALEKRHLTSLHATMVFTWSGHEAGTEREKKAALQVSSQPNLRFGGN